MTQTSQPSPAAEFDELLERYSDLAYRMAWKLTGGRESEARDLVQDGFLKIWIQWQKERPASFHGWIYRMLHNLHVDAVRRSARRPAMSLDLESGSGDSLYEAIPSHEPTLEAHFEQREIKTSVASALAQLEPEFRVPVVLCDIENRSYDEIARLLACPVGTVRSRIHRGRFQLRQILSVALAGMAAFWLLWQSRQTLRQTVALEALIAQYRQHENRLPLAKNQPNERRNEWN